jgi:imidazolonepropionase-like amidohydrolase
MKIILTFILAVVVSFNPALSQIAVKGETIYTMSGNPIEKGIVLINKGKIEKLAGNQMYRYPKVMK